MEPPKIPEYSARLLHTLRHLKVWCTQSMIAAHMGLDRLEGGDLLALNLLVERRFIEVRYVRSGRGRTVEYRFIDLGDEADTLPMDVME